jgi:hypothetical protein
MIFPTRNESTFFYGSGSQVKALECYFLLEMAFSKVRYMISINYPVEDGFVALVFIFTLGQIISSA